MTPQISPTLANFIIRRHGSPQVETHCPSHSKFSLVAGKSTGQTGNCYVAIHLLAYHWQQILDPSLVSPRKAQAKRFTRVWVQGFNLSIFFCSPLCPNMDKRCNWIAVVQHEKERSGKPWYIDKRYAKDRTVRPFAKSPTKPTRMSFSLPISLWIV